MLAKYNGTKMPICSGEFLSGYLQNRFMMLEQEIKNEAKNQMLNVDELSYVEYMTKKYTINPIEFHWDQQQVDSYEKTICFNDLPIDRQFVMMGAHNSNQTYLQNTVVYQVPFTGDVTLLQYKPSTYSMSAPLISINQNTLTFEIAESNPNSNELVKNEIERNKSAIRQLISTLNSELNTYNNSIKNKITDLVKTRKKELLRQSQLLESIGIPLVRTSTPNELIIPIHRKPLIIQKPASSNGEYKAEPVLEEAIYQDILKSCYALGTRMEKLPSTYRNENDKVKGEEAIRDSFLLQLGLQYKNSATGETFNKSGKTDILIPHEGKNAFVAECKFWRGTKLHQETRL